MPRSRDDQIRAKKQFLSHNTIQIFSNFCDQKNLIGGLLSISKNLRLKGQGHHKTKHRQNLKIKSHSHIMTKCGTKYCLESHGGLWGGGNVRPRHIEST